MYLAFSLHCWPLPAGWVCVWCKRKGGRGCGWRDLSRDIAWSWTPNFIILAQRFNELRYWTTWRTGSRWTNMTSCEFNNKFLEKKWLQSLAEPLPNHYGTTAKPLLSNRRTSSKSELRVRLYFIFKQNCNCFNLFSIFNQLANRFTW